MGTASRALHTYLVAAWVVLVLPLPLPPLPLLPPLPPLLCYSATTPATTATAAHLVLKTILGSSLVTEPRKCHCACSKGALATWQLSAWSAASGCVMKATW